ncbi:hypothetical protein [Lysinibacillus sphaericus]|uniref:hypothetical protein n=1 Tax=Lysinibacillus sphaericus TaxID=1421 RepID=UPI003D0174A8
MEFIQKIFELTPLGIVFFIIYYLLKLYDKKSKNHDLDFALTPSWLDLLERIILNLLASFFISFIIIAEMVSYFKNLEVENNSIELQELLVSFGMIFLTVAMYIIILWNCTKSLNNLFCGKKTFYTKLKDEVWEIEKAHSKDVLYLKLENRRLMHTYNGGIEIFSEQNQSEKVKDFYKKLGNIKYYRIGGLVLFIVTMVCNAYFYLFQKESIIVVLIVSILLLALIFNFIIGFNTYIDRE